MKTRSAAVELNWNGAAVTSQMKDYKTEITYTDPASGEADSLDIAIQDRAQQWTTAWLPATGDTLTATILAENWEKEGDNRKLDCGFFILDHYEFNGWPMAGMISAVSVPADGSFRATERTKTWEDVTIQEIGKEIADRAGISLAWDVEGEPFKIKSLEQTEQTDCDFFMSLCDTYGLAMKVYSPKIVVYDREAYKEKDPVGIIREDQIENWNWTRNLAGTYTGVRYQYTHTEKNQTFTVNVGGGERILTCDDAANNQTEATLIALAKVNNANKGTTTMKITLRTPAWNIVATQCIVIKGLGQLSGKYYVEKATHTVADGTKTSLELRRVEKRFVKQAEPIAPIVISSSTAEEKNSSTTFKKGDKVRVTKGAKTYTGVQLASFVYTTVYDVIQVGGRNLPDDRIVIGLGSAVTAAVKAADLYPA